MNEHVSEGIFVSDGTIREKPSRIENNRLPTPDAPEAEATGADKSLALLEQVERGEVRVPPETLRRLRTHKANSKREADVLARGWEPTTINRQVAYLGLVEPVRVRRTEYWVATLVLVGFVASWLVALAIAAVFGSWEGTVAPMAAVGGGLCLAFGGAWVMASFVEGFHWWEERPHRDRFLQRIYEGPMPMAVWKKYQRDKHLFDDVAVGSNVEAHFRQFRPVERNLVDPYLLGRIGNQWFLGAQWDLAEELATADERAGAQDS